MSTRGIARHAWVVVVWLMISFLWTEVAVSGSGSYLLSEKIDPRLFESFATTGRVTFLVRLQAKADLRAASEFHRKEQRGQFVLQQSSRVAKESQHRLVSLLQELEVRFRSFWIVNMIRVEGDLELLRRLAEYPEVESIVIDAPLALDFPVGNVEENSRATEQTAFTPEVNLTAIGAPAVWAEGVTGVGAVVAGMDTGYEWEHPALKPQYRGWQGGFADHSYDWHDAIHFAPGTVCPADSPEPCDEDGHGTHTMGTMVGDDGLGNQIGVAPGAKWIGCRCWEPVGRTALSYVTECFEWFVAPTDIFGGNPNPAMAPHAINNSWICEPSEGCTDPNALLEVVQNVRAAGIVVVASAGNDGPNCETISFPPAIYEDAFSVGASHNGGGIASFSSRGPVGTDGSQRLKPNVTAPGVEVRSSVPGGFYQSAGWSGTSMAGPHVVGTIALMISANPELAGQVELIETILEETASQATSSQMCGGLSSNASPNHAYGHGFIDAYAAYRAALAATPAPLQLPTRLALRANVPNPFNPRTRITYELPASTNVRLVIYDAQGQLVRNLVDVPIQQAGVHDAWWDGRDDRLRSVASGIYFYQLQTTNGSHARRMVLIR